ncbi:MAG: hypothetical protein LUQ40_06550 [Methanomicrobiales archaeon]|nr:hypothetical protein [Methanomicrobiales archaeon]
MDAYKRIELLIGTYISRNYRNAVEIGVGKNFDVARLLRRSGVGVRCTDIKPMPEEPGIPTCIDDIFSPDRSLYEAADLLYAVRPAIEMVPPMIRLSQELQCDLLVYHLGFELYGDGGELIDCGVVLHRYHVRENPSKRDD